MPLHATESLLLLAWALAQVPSRAALRAVSIAASGHWGLVFVSIFQAVRGESLGTTFSLVALAVGLVAIAGMFIWAFVAPLRASGKGGLHMD